MDATSWETDMFAHGDGTIICGKKLEEQEGTWAGFGTEQCSEDPAIPPPGCASLYNTCLLGGTFPDRWKRQKPLLL